MVCEKLFNRIDELNEQYLDILEDVCNIESPTAFKEGVDKVGNYFVELAKKRGWDVEISKQDKAGDAICITMNKDAKGQPVCISGHIDTVFPVGLFGTPAVKRDKEKMYGPGVEDCKGGVVAGFMAMHALEECGFDKRPIRLIIQSDEETSSKTSKLSTVEFMCEKSKDALFFLNLEGHSDNSAVIQRKGILKSKFTVTGKATHASRCYIGANAILEAAEKIKKIEQFKDAEGITCNVGLIKGGTTVNTVAAKCEFCVDSRFADNEQYEKIKSELVKIANETTVSGCNTEFEEISVRPAMFYSEKNVKFLEKMNEIYAENNLPVLKAGKSGGGSDAAYITQIGVPCVDSIGTEGDCIHSVNEYIKLSSLSESAKRIASIIYCI